MQTVGKYFERHNKRSLPAQNPERNLKSCFNFDVHVKSKATAMDFFFCGGCYVKAVKENSDHFGSFFWYFLGVDYYEERNLVRIFHTLRCLLIWQHRTCL